MFRNSKPLGREIFRTRGFSAQVAVSSRLKASEYEDAKKFSDIPTLSRFELFRRFRPGGIFHKASMVEIQRSLRDELGTIYQLPGMIGQNNMVTTFDADDVEYVHRNEGTYPFRRGMETLKYYRSNVRPDIFSVGGLIVE